MPPEDQQSDRDVYCEVCSVAGGADMTIYHDDPPCKEPAWVKAGAECRKRRREARLSMVPIAEELGTTVTRVSGMERGVFIPDALVEYWKGK